MARTTTRQPLTNGTRTSNQATRQRNTLPDTSRDTSNHSRLLLFTGVKTVARVCGRPGPSWNSADGEGRRAKVALAEERIQNPGTVLRQLLGQDKGPAIRANSGGITIGAAIAVEYSGNT